MPALLAPATARPTKGERTRARILTAAAEHFAVVGRDAGSVPEIGRRIGVSHGTIYQYFGRKDDLFRAAVEADLSALFATLDPTFDAGGIEPETIVGMLRTLVVASGAHPLARRIIAEIDAEQTIVLLDLPALRDLEARLADALASAQDAGTVRHDLPATSLAAGVIGMALPMLVVAFRLEGLPAIPRADAAVELLVAALRPLPSPRRSSR